jgi:hypothetical protein
MEYRTPFGNTVWQLDVARLAVLFSVNSILSRDLVAQIPETSQGYRAALPVVVHLTSVVNVAIRHAAAGVV